MSHFWRLHSICHEINPAFRIASVAFKPPYVVSGSSDNHLRLINISTSEGWSTSPEFDTQSTSASTLAGLLCSACGNPTGTSAAANASQARRLRAHEDLVRTVALNNDFVITGSYDHTIKVWDRKTGAFVADLSGGHSGRIFCVGFDCSKVRVRLRSWIYKLFTYLCFISW